MKTSFVAILIGNWRNLKVCVLQSFPRFPLPPHHLVWWFTGRPDRTQCIVVLTAKTITTKGYKAQSAKGKGTWLKSGMSFQGVSPSWVTQDVLDYTSNELWQRMWNVVCHRSSLETHCPGFLSGAGHVGTLYQANSKFQTPRGKAVHHKPHCSYKQFRPSESFLPVLGIVGILSKSKFPHDSQWVTSKQTFQRIAASGLLC